MNQVKGVVQGVAKESSQAKVPDHLVKNDLVCILRTRDLLANQEQIFPVKETLSIIERIKRKLFRSRNNYNFRPICAPPNKYVTILRKFLDR